MAEESIFTTRYPDMQKLVETSNKLADIGSAIALLKWDEETYMPKGAIEARGAQIATLEKIAHEILVFSCTEHLLCRLQTALDSNGDSDQYSLYDRVLIGKMRKAFHRSARVPVKLVGELAEACSLATDCWQKARTASNFGIFRDALARVVDLKLQEADHVGYIKTPYNVFLDDCEDGLTEECASSFLKDASEATHRIIAKIQTGKIGDISHRELRTKLSRQGLELFTLEVLKAMGFDFERGRQDVSTHPFTAGTHQTDVRITTRFNEELFVNAIFSSIHEGGHGLYEQGIDIRLARTLLARPDCSMAMHESQSRLWENCIGRSPAFWRHWYPILLRYHYPDIRKDRLSEAYLVRAINKVSPSFIRVDADEVTYNLHIVLRFELERDLFAGTITVDDLPELWNERFAALLGWSGLRVSNDAHGILQDVHWSQGLFGYFPSYTLGNIYAAQIYRTIRHEISDFDDRIARGELLFVREWLREKIHQHGAVYAPHELLKRVTGTSPSVQYLEQYLEEKFKNIYLF